MPVRIYSWNVNGLRAIGRKGFGAWLASSDAEIAAIQETRCRLEQLDDGLASPPGYGLSLCVACKRKGYSGVGIYSRRVPDEVETALGAPRFDEEGRLQLARFGALTIANVYFPNGSGTDRDHSRVPYKLDFYRALFARLEPLFAAGQPVLVMGDFNTALEDIDLARPKTNKKTSGFLPSERQELRRWMDAGWIDTFREFEKGEGHYSWWSNRKGVRERNVGWRIDLILASPAAMRHVVGAAIHPEVMGSDHCPISVDVEPGIFTQ